MLVVAGGGDNRRHNRHCHILPEQAAWTLECYHAIILQPEIENWPKNHILTNTSVDCEEKRIKKKQNSADKFAKVKSERCCLLKSENTSICLFRLIVQRIVALLVCSSVVTKVFNFKYRYSSLVQGLKSEFEWVSVTISGGFYGI